MKNILIIGCGLLGSSLLRRISKKKIAKKIFIYEKSKLNISKIKKLKLPGTIVKSLKEGVTNSDLIISIDLCFDEPISVIICFVVKFLLIFKIVFLYSLIGVQKIIRSELTTPSFNDFTIVPGNLNFFILATFAFDLS